MPLHTITISPGTPATFNPSNLAAFVGDDIFWANNDTKNHQPAPQGGPANAWVGFPILPGSTNPDQLTPGPNTVNAAQPYTLTYVCALDNTMAPATITVSPAP
jgi:plastocyanin